MLVAKSDSKPIHKVLIDQIWKFAFIYFYVYTFYYELLLRCAVYSIWIYCNFLFPFLYLLLTFEKIVLPLYFSLSSPLGLTLFFLFFFFYFYVCWQPFAVLTMLSCWVIKHTHACTHTQTLLPHGVSGCYGHSTMDKTSNRQINKKGLKFCLVFGDFHINTVFSKVVFRHACSFRNTRKARLLNKLNYKVWGQSSPNSTVLFMGHKEPQETTGSLK